MTFVWSKTCRCLRSKTKETSKKVKMPFTFHNQVLDLPLVSGLRENFADVLNAYHFIKTKTLENQCPQLDWLSKNLPPMKNWDQQANITHKIKFTYFIQGEFQKSIQLYLILRKWHKDLSISKEYKGFPYFVSIKSSLRKKFEKNDKDALMLFFKTFP